MKNRYLLSTAGKVTVTALIVATIGVIIQIGAGWPYPAVPPVFFILLIPAGLLSFTSWRWASLSAVAASGFLTAGFFSSGSYYRMVKFQHPGVSIGLWVQALGVLVALLAALSLLIRSGKVMK